MGVGIEFGVRQKGNGDLGGMELQYVPRWLGIRSGFGTRDDLLKR